MVARSRCKAQETHGDRATNIRAKRPRLHAPARLGCTRRAEPWRDLDGVAFCHWDRWLLRLALEEPQGLTAIGREFVRRAQQHAQRDVAEAMLAQVRDLDARLKKTSRAPADMLDAIERESTWLRDKAFGAYGTRARFVKPKR